MAGGAPEKMARDDPTPQEELCLVRKLYFVFMKCFLSGGDYLEIG